MSRRSLGGKVRDQGQSSSKVDQNDGKRTRDNDRDGFKKESKVDGPRAGPCVYSQRCGERGLHHKLEDCFDYKKTMSRREKAEEGSPSKPKGKFKSDGQAVRSVGALSRSVDSMHLG